MQQTMFRLRDRRKSEMKGQNQVNERTGTILAFLLDCWRILVNSRLLPANLVLLCLLIRKV